MDELLSLEEAFLKLIQKRAWYKNCTTIGFRQAQKDKLEFLRGKNISADRIRTYLISAGAECVQEEKWNFKI